MRVRLRALLLVALLALPGLQGARAAEPPLLTLRSFADLMRENEAGTVSATEGPPGVWLVTIPTASTTRGVDVYGLRNATIQLDAPVLDARSAQGIRIESVARVVIQHPRLSALAGDAIWLKNVADGTRIVEPSIAASGGRGIAVATAANVSIEGGSIEATGGAGIWLEDVRNGSVTGTGLSFNALGVGVARSTQIRLADLEVRAARVGIALDAVRDATVTRNKIAVGNPDIRLRAVNGSVFDANNLSIDSGSIAVELQDRASLDNVFEPGFVATNVVNFVPLRIHANAAGRTFRDEEMGVRGATNLGQVICYRCRDVELTGIHASSGVAAGIALLESSDVRVTSSLVEGNAEAGVVARDSVRILVANLSANANHNATTRLAAGVLVDRASDARLENLSATANDVGVRVVASSSTSVFAASAERNLEGIVFEDATGGRLASSRASDSARTGIRLAGATGTQVEDVTSQRNGAHGIALEGTRLVTVRHANASDNAAAGFVIAKPAAKANSILQSEAAGNGQAGAWLQAAGELNEISGNIFAGQPAGVRLTTSLSDVFHGNAIQKAPAQVGFQFDDAASYQSEIDETNLVSGEPMRWITALAGTPQAPIEIAGLRAEVENVTNVAQIMVYRSSYLHLDGFVAHNGTRGVYVVGSSSISARGFDVSRNGVGLALEGTQTASVLDVDASATTTGVLVAATANATLRRVVAHDASVGVRLDAASRGAIVEGTDATGVRLASVADVSYHAADPPTSNHRIVDAGLDKLVAANANVRFDDAIGVAQAGNERIVSQAWDFGDGAHEERLGASPLQPTHAYAAPGTYRAIYRVETADGLSLADDVGVHVVAPPQMPEDVRAVNRSQVLLDWTPPPSEVPVEKYRVYAGPDPRNLTLLLETVDSQATLPDKLARSMDVWYAISAVSLGGEGPRTPPADLRAQLAPTPVEPTPPPASASPVPPPPSPEDGLHPRVPGPAAWGVALAALVAALLGRRRAG